MADMTIANEITKQIGGQAFCMMGAKYLVGGDDYLTFKVGGGARCEAGVVTHIKIILDAGSDTYRFEAIYVRGTKEPKIRMEMDGAYADMIHDFLRDATGFALSL